VVLGFEPSEVEFSQPYVLEFDGNNEAHDTNLQLVIYILRITKIFKLKEAQFSRLDLLFSGAPERTAVRTFRFR
jgi:hypothetical protein